ncbi:MAG TPA: hypothetical protein VJ853_14395 [Thermoanaerobaculia bacterium]|nr:hypothetical protein [Thermoanaerobaculia bacterium]
MAAFEVGQKRFDDSGKDPLPLLLHIVAGHAPHHISVYAAPERSDGRHQRAAVSSAYCSLIPRFARDKLKIVKVLIANRGESVYGERSEASAVGLHCREWNR